MQSKKGRPEIPDTEDHAGEKPKLAKEELTQVPKQAQTEGLQISVRKEELVHPLPGDHGRRQQMTRICDDLILQVGDMTWESRNWESRAEINSILLSLHLER